MPRVSQPALQYFHSFLYRLSIELRLGRPAPAQIGKPISLAWRHVPRRRLRALNRDRLRGPIPNRRRPPNDSAIRIHAVVQRDLDGIANVLHHNV